MFNNNQDKPPGFPLPQPDQQHEWNINHCTWKSNEGASSAIMLFNGVSTLGNSNLVQPQPLPGPSTSGFFVKHPRVKRKSESDDIVPAKHFISEEKMIAHLNGMHLSESFQPHNINLEETEKEEDGMEPPVVRNVNLTPQELEQRLKNAQRIIVCDEVRKRLKDDQEIFPKVLLDRIEQPCRALMVWQPPKALEKLLTNFDYKSDDDDDDEEIEMDDINNNDPNNDMDMDL